MTILDVPVISRIRRNHGLEHATLTMLGQRFPHLPLAGYSFPGGFFVFGNVPTADLRAAADQALARMNNGERQLAVHPNCGTNLLTTGVTAGLLAWLGMVGARTKRDKVERLPLVIILATLGLFIGQPLGLKVQEKITTSGELQGLSIVDVFPVQFGKFTLHRVATQG